MQLVIHTNLSHSEQIGAVLRRFDPTCPQPLPLRPLTAVAPKLELRLRRRKLGEIYEAHISTKRT
jgi:hypothetical protein